MMRRLAMLLALACGLFALAATRADPPQDVAIDPDPFSGDPLPTPIYYRVMSFMPTSWYSDPYHVYPDEPVYPVFEQGRLDYNAGMSTVWSMAVFSNAAGDAWYWRFMDPDTTLPHAERRRVQFRSRYAWGTFDGTPDNFSNVGLINQDRSFYGVISPPFQRHDWFLPWVGAQSGVTFPGVDPPWDWAHPDIWIALQTTPFPPPCPVCGSGQCGASWH
jgi:hypothetical protein